MNYPGAYNRLGQLGDTADRAWLGNKSLEVLTEAINDVSITKRFTGAINAAQHFSLCNGMNDWLSGQIQDRCGQRQSKHNTSD